MEFIRLANRINSNVDVAESDWQRQLQAVNAWVFRQFIGDFKYRFNRELLIF